MQSSKLYVGNVSYSATAEELRELFAQYGEVKQVNLMEGRGYGFVEMSSTDEATKAKDALNGSNFKGRTLKVDEARQPGNKQKKGFRKY
ncbi:MAG: RNA-binding protein [candidate division WOR-3 bacterium]|nr:MAG: RNA-binding protein [candidate division WOR-3 bacterium]